MSADRLIEVVKVGGSVLCGSDRGDRIDRIDRIGRTARGLVAYARGRQLLVVVSAMRGTTDRLERLVERLGRHQDPTAHAALLATGERRAAAALALAFGNAGRPATLLDPFHVGPWTSGAILDAAPVAVSVRHIRRALERRSVAILPGFVGRTPSGATALLGRGGSDLTALFVAGVALQAKAIRFAKAHRQLFHVGSLVTPHATLVGPGPTTLYTQRDPCGLCPLDRNLKMARRYHTRLIHVEAAPGDPLAPMNTPIYQTANFEQPDATTFGPYDYTRSGNPTRSVLEGLLADLHGAHASWAFCSGMAALGTVLRSLESAARVLAGHDVYGGTYRLLQSLHDAGRLQVQWVDTTDSDEVTEALQRPAALLLLETPGNPMLRVSDIHLLSEIARPAKTLVAVDNSTMSPHLQRPLELGADIVIESATKFLSGHGDVVAGVVAVADPDLGRQIGWLQNAEGAGLAPFESWLLLRSIKTLAVRLERQQASAQRVARFLEQHPAVARVHYPGLPHHPLARVHSRQATGPGSVLSLELTRPDRAARFVNATRLFKVAVSFGGVTSLISLPGYMSHAPVPAAARRLRKLPEGLVRVSIGLEDPADLIEDLDSALQETPA